MKIGEVHAKPDRRCVIAIRQHTKIFEVLTRTDQRIPAYTFTKDHRTFIQISFPKSGKPAQSMNSILSMKDLVEKGSYYYLTERINNVEDMKVIGNLLEAPSVALNDAYPLKDGLYLYFRIVKLKDSSSHMDTMQEIHSQTQLAVVRYSNPQASDNLLMNHLADNPSDDVAEVDERLTVISGGQ